MKNIKNAKPKILFILVFIILSTIILIIGLPKFQSVFDSFYYLYISSENKVSQYNDLEYSILENGHLDKNQMIKDFNILYETIAKNLMPEERNVKEYGFDFAANYEKYRNEILACNNEFEFYAVMTGILSDVPSCHTQIISPEYCQADYNIFRGCYNSDCFESYNERMLQSAELMNSYIKEFVSQSNDLELLTFNYIDGNYELNRKGGTSYNLSDGCYTLELINGNPPENFVADELHYRKLQYDEINDKLFRDLIIFNDTYGIECTLTLGCSDGKQIEVAAYGGVKGEIVSIYSMAEKIDSEMQEETESVSSSKITENEFICDNLYSYIDENILYANFYSFDLPVNVLVDYRNFITNCSYDAVIIDLRENSGGISSNFSNYIYPLFFSDNRIKTEITYGVINDETKIAGAGFYFHTPSDGIFYQYKKVSTNLFGASKRMYKLTSEEKYWGNSVGTANIYVLVSWKTCSAADKAAYFMKTETDALIIGTNTGGEGYSSYVMKVLPNSGLIMAYTPFMTEDLKRSVIGTSPDIFCTVSLENYRKNVDLYLSGEVCYPYEMRLKWDNVLIKTLEIIKEDEKDKQQ